MNERNLSIRDSRRAAADPRDARSQFKTINEFALDLLYITTRNELVWYVAREVVGRMGFGDCVVYLIDPERGLLRQVAAIGIKNPHSDKIINALEIPVGQGITGHVAETRQPLIIDNLAEDSRYIPDVEPALSEICVPLMIDDEVVGVIDCEDPRPGHFGPDHLEILTTIAAMTSAKLKLINEARRLEERTEAMRRLNNQLREEIAERLQAEEKLRENEALIRSLIEHSPVAISIKDMEGRYSFVSPAFAHYLGIPAEQAVGKSADDLLAPDTLAAIKGSDQAIMTSGKPLRLDEAFSAVIGPATLLVNKFPIQDDDGNTIGVGTVGLDITDRIRIEDRLRESEALLAGALRQARLAYWSYSFAKQVCVSWSEEAAHVIGVAPAEIPTTLEAHLEIVHAEDRERVASVYGTYGREESAAFAHEDYQIEYRILRPDGRVVWLREIGGVERDAAGAAVGYQGTIQDITEYKDAEERLLQAQKMEAIGQLTGGVAHDFNNLLAVIQGNTDLLIDAHGQDNAETQAILRASQLGAELTRRLLAFSRRQPLRPKRMDLGELVSGMSDLFERSLGETIEITIASPPDLWATSADPGQVENAVLNLAINARDAMPGGGRLKIECANVSRNGGDVRDSLEVPAGDYVMLTVSDTGDGMSAEVREHAFEPFFTTKQPGEGSGLGLSMVYGFVKQSGGHAIIDSEEGKGTIVSFFLPRSAEPAEPKDDPATSRDPRGRGEVVLIIEDDPEVRVLVSKIVRSLGYRVIDVAEASAARAVLEREKVDLLLSDVVLPGGTTGPAFAREARARDPRLKVVFMSGYPATRTAHDSLTGDDDVLLDKPFQRSRLARTLREALD